MQPSIDLDATDVRGVLWLEVRPRPLRVAPYPGRFSKLVRRHRRFVVTRVPPAYSFGPPKVIVGVPRIGRQPDHDARVRRWTRDETGPGSYEQR
jgi:hypothetical protein